MNYKPIIHSDNWSLYYIHNITNKTPQPPDIKNIETVVSPKINIIPQYNIKHQMLMIKPEKSGFGDTKGLKTN